MQNALMMTSKPPNTLYITICLENVSNNMLSYFFIEIGWKVPEVDFRMRNTIIQGMLSIVQLLLKNLEKENKTFHVRSIQPPVLRTVQSFFLVFTRKLKEMALSDKNSYNYRMNEQKLGLTPPNHATSTSSETLKYMLIIRPCRSHKKKIQTRNESYVPPLQSILLKSLAFLLPKRCTSGRIAHLLPPTSQPPPSSEWSERLSVVIIEIIIEFNL